MRPNTRAFLVWLGPALVVGVAVARVSVWVQPHFSRIVFFPLLIGAALGAILCGLMQVARLSSLRLALLGTVITVLIAAGAEHGFYYLDHRTKSLAEQLKAGVPEEVWSVPGFSEYMRAEATLHPEQPALWVLNPILMAIAAVGVVVWYMKTQSPPPNPLPEGEVTTHTLSNPLPNGEGDHHS